MTEVEFHTGVAEPVAYACRLLRKAARQGVQVQVTAPAELLSALDRSLWTFEERDFVPHVRVPGASTAVAQRTPIWLTGTLLTEAAPRVLVNLGGQMPVGLDALDRIIEIVSAEPDEAALGRERWRDYKALGLPIKHHADAAASRG